MFVAGPKVLGLGFKASRAFLAKNPDALPAFARIIPRNKLVGNPAWLRYKSVDDT